MVAGKVNQAPRLRNPPTFPPRSSSSAASDKKTTSSSSVFGRSIGAYFPARSSAQVQPRPPDVSDLLRLVEELRDREHRLKTQLLEHKLLKEAVAFIPALEDEIASKTTDLEIFGKRIEVLEAENQKLVELVASVEEERREKKELEFELAEMKRKMSDRVSVENEEVSASKRFQGLIEASSKSNLIRTLSAMKVSRSGESVKAPEMKKEELESDRPSNSSDEFSPDISVSDSANVRSRVPRVPKPPPMRISSSGSSLDERKSPENSGAVVHPPPPPPLPLRAKPAPPPPPPPLPAKASRSFPAKVRRVPEVVEFYHSLMRRDSRRDSGNGTVEVSPASAKDLVGEFENRSSYLLAIKTDVETQGDFIRFLIKQVEEASFTAIEDVVSFVKWLDDELCYLVDERAVLKHFSWPEQKADALREAAFAYCDLKKVESEASVFVDNVRQPCSLALKKMQTLLEKLEHGVYNLSRLRESATIRFKSFHIPVDWMLETGPISQIKLASVKLAVKYMKRASAGLETVLSGGPEEEELIVQGVRFAFRVHQFAGGFDVETMRAFAELRDKARTCHVALPRPAPEARVPIHTMLGT